MKRVSFIYLWILKIFGLVFLCCLNQTSELPPADTSEKVRVFTRQIEFDFVAWSVQALNLKCTQWALGTEVWLPHTKRIQMVNDYLQLTEQIFAKDSELNLIYSSPDYSQKLEEAAILRNDLILLNKQNAQISPIIEAFLQNQLSEVIAQTGLSTMGQAMPPPLYHVSPLPLALIISPREVIQQDLQVSLLPTLTLEEIIQLEDSVAQTRNVSALVVEIGGIGLYPTMVMKTTDFNWLTEVVAHEWAHNYLTLHPLGLLYDISPALRTMNETTASIMGKELGHALISRYYSERMSKITAHAKTRQTNLEENDFNFNREMHKTRIEVDRLLAQGKIVAAEEYMEKRRLFFWEHGYAIRKLNQAYFAFHGAYANEPQGAAGEDPVGNAVRVLRSQQNSLAEFVHLMVWMWSEDQLYQAVQEP